MPTAATKLQPMWTKRVAMETGGRDPLGLSRVADMIKEFLLSGINTNNTRARYYSFYCWALWNIEHEENPKDYKGFVAAFRRREAALVLATLAQNPGTSPVGVKAAREHFDTGQETGLFNCNFKVLPSKSLGGYEQYYAGSLYHLKLYQRSEDDPCDRVTKGIAEELAQAFHTSIENTPYVKKKLYKETSIPKADLMKSKEFLTLNALEQSFTMVERAKLIDIFFGFSNQFNDQATVLRRHTLTLLLHAIAEYEHHDIRADASKREILDEYLLYAFYYSSLWIDGAKAINYKTPEPLTFCCDLWKQFCLHQFLIQAVESLLNSVLEVLSAEGGGLTLDVVIARLLRPEFFEAFEEATGEDCARPCELLSIFGIESVPDAAFSQKLQKRLLPDHALSEAQILSFDFTAPQSIAARGVLLLATLYGKWRGAANDYALSYVATRAGQDLWVGSVLPYLDCWLEESVTWDTALRTLIEKFVLEQHDHIMYEKGKLESCWLDRTEGRIVKVQDYEPVWRSSRHYNAVRIMRDLSLVRINNIGEVAITAQGRKTLEKALTQSHGTPEE